MAFLPDAGIETIDDKLKTVLKLRSATVNDIPVLMHMARALAEQQGPNAIDDGGRRRLAA